MTGPGDAEILRRAGLHLTECTSIDGLPAYQVSGDTHSHRQALRQAGGAWDKMKRLWLFTGSDPAPALARHLSDPAVADRTHTTGGLSDDRPDRPHYWGHRERLRQRFMEGGPDALPDYELLELILFQCVERVDVKPLAKELLATFGGLGGILAAEPDRLAGFSQLGYAAVVHFKALHACQSRVAREEIARGPVLSSWDKLISYLKTALAHAGTERFQVLFLNARNELIADEVQQTGTVNHTPLYPREVIKRALDLGATAIIMVHNHPSGDPAPSSADISMTRQLAEAAEKLDITVHDHIIMSKHGHTSFRDLGLL